jgi:hypothetical protein
MYFAYLTILCRKGLIWLHIFSNLVINLQFANQNVNLNIPIVNWKYFDVTLRMFYIISDYVY